MNARGLQLSNADLIKNQLFSRLLPDDHMRQELEELWVQLEDIVDIEKLDTFLSNHRTSIVAEKAQKSLSEEFESIIAGEKGTPIDFVKRLISSAENFERIDDDDFVDASTLRSLAAIKRVTFDEWTPALLAYLNKPVSGLDEREYLSLLEKITMQNWVRRLGRTKRNGTYYRLIRSINKDEDADTIRSIFRESANNEEVFSLLQGDIYGLPSARAILLRLEEGAQDDSVTKKFGGSITIEHVLPQTLKGEYWTSRFTSETHLRWLHKLGNLTLLSGKKNTKAQNWSFPEKKGVYEKKNEKVSFDLTKDVCLQTDWTVSEIENREKVLLERAESLWKID